MAVTQSPDLTTRKIRRVAIVSIDPIPTSQTARVPYPAPPGAISPEAKGGNHDVTILFHNLLYNTMATLPQWQIISDREVREAQTTVRSLGDARERARKLGEIVFADAVVFGRILRFRERVGEEMGVTSSASVAFELFLLDVKRGDVVWSARFQETQRPLTDNIFAIREFTQRGGRWLTAEELVYEGIKKVVAQLHRTLYPSS